MKMVAFVMIVALVVAGTARADERPIAGTVKGVDTGAQTLTLQTTAKGKMREVTVHIKPGASIVRFVRGTEPGRTGFVEQPLTLADLKPGWIVSVTARHDGDREVAQTIKVVLER